LARGEPAARDLCVDDAADQRVAPDRETLEKRIAWQKKMHAAGWVGISWPKEYGGRGVGFMEQVIFDEEYFRARAPVLPTFDLVSRPRSLIFRAASRAGARTRRGRGTFDLVSRPRSLIFRAAASRAGARTRRGRGSVGAFTRRPTRSRPRSASRH
jgi:hypothetical protein